MVIIYWEQSPAEKGAVILYNENDCFYPKYDSYLQKYMVLCFAERKETIE
jgi:hypothetical protein